MASSGGSMYSNGELVESYGPNGPSGQQKKRRSPVSYDRESGTITNRRSGKTRMAGEKMQAYQAKIDAAAQRDGSQAHFNQQIKRENRNNKAREMKANRAERQQARFAENGEQGMAVGGGMQGDDQYYAS